MIEVAPPAHYTDLPLLRGLALLFPYASSTLYLYKPAHLFMLRKHLREPFVVTPPGEARAQLGTVCRVEEVQAVGQDGAWGRGAGLRVASCARCGGTSGCASSRRTAW